RHDYSRSGRRRVLGCLRRFPNPRAGSPICWPDPNSQRTHDKCFEPTGEVKRVKAGVSKLLPFARLLTSHGTGKPLLGARVMLEAVYADSVVIFPPTAMRHSSLWREDCGAAFRFAQSRPVMDRHSVELEDIPEK